MNVEGSPELTQDQKDAIAANEKKMAEAQAAQLRMRCLEYALSSKEVGSTTEQHIESANKYMAFIVG